MPTPFSTPVEKSAATVVETVAVLNSVLTCQFCFADSSEGTYYPDKETLIWDCDDCSETNIVKGIRL